MNNKIIAKVVKGSGKGKRIGSPTINLSILEGTSPKKGVYIIKCWYDDIEYEGVSSVSDNPTFPDKSFSIELHLFNYQSQIPLEAKIKVCFLHYIRNEKKFENVSDLQKQISKDIENAKHFFIKK